MAICCLYFRLIAVDRHSFWVLAYVGEVLHMGCNHNPLYYEKIHTTPVVITLGLDLNNEQQAVNLSSFFLLTAASSHSVALDPPTPNEPSSKPSWERMASDANAGPNPTPTMVEQRSSLPSSPVPVPPSSSP